MIAQALQGAQGAVGGSKNAAKTLDPLPALEPLEALRSSSSSSTPEGVNQRENNKRTGDTGLQVDFNSALNKLIADSGGKVTLNSGYRSPEKQAQLWAKALKKYGSAEAARKWVAPPGNSQHNFGTAADLGYADAATKEWVHENARQYGLHFPLDNEDWHIEPTWARN